MKGKMVKCKTCGADIAQSAKSCPNCGAKCHQGTYIAVSIITVLAVFAIVFVLVKDPSQESAPSTEPKSTISVSAEALYTAYVENEVNADNQYNDQVISVTGLITNIGKDVITGAPCVSLSSGDSYGLYPIQCFFPKELENNSDIAALKDGQSVTIIGTCEGTLVAHVQLSGCSIAE